MCPAIRVGKKKEVSALTSRGGGLHWNRTSNLMIKSQFNGLNHVRINFPRKICKIDPMRFQHINQPPLWWFSPKLLFHALVCIKFGQDLGKAIMPANRVKSVFQGRRWKEDRRRHYLNCQRIKFA